MPVVYLTRKESFNAAHKLWVNEWTAEQNLATFGKCSNPNYHGHNYTLYVTVKGHPDPVTGYVFDAKRLSDLMKTYVTEVLDHKNINLDPNFLPEGMQPTSENLSVQIWLQLAPHLPAGVALHCVRLQETEKIYAEYFGE